jgi:UDP-N-acetylmuramate--alanine ligase
MTDLTTYKYFYFLGIGGIGMSALARYFNSKGFDVAGYDKTPSDLTDQLVREGIKIHFEDDINQIPAKFLEHKNDMLVTYTPAIPKDHKEHQYLADQGFKIIKRAEVLASVTIGKQTIAVAGTHGKTSTASIIAHILKTGDIPFYAFLGGIASNYKTNFLEPEKNTDSALVVVEADEFDRSFHQLNPDISIITAVESDHLDIYGTEKNLQIAFTEFAKKTKPSGTLIVHKNLPIELPEAGKQLTYAATANADIYSEYITILDHKYHFDAVFQDERLSDLVIGIPGIHNIENSLAAMAATRHLVSDNAVYYKALSTFKGVHRRFEVVLRNKHVVYIDDYAHHPTEIKVTLQTVRDMYPAKKLLGVFQPHLFSRTKDLAKDFAESLSLLDELVLLPIYPARELPMPGVTSQLILDDVTCSKKQIAEKESVLDILAKTDADVIITLGAGDIDRLVQPIKKLLEAKYK